MDSSEKLLTKMPALFIGHGSPMNALANNRYTQTLNELGHNLPKPTAVLMVSAHWNTQGTWVTAMENPKTIHDFYGFPDELFAVQYPAPGSPEIAKQIQSLVTSQKIQLDLGSWGLDHGAWSILRHIYPKADVPIVQISLDLSLPLEQLVQLGRELSVLRDQGVMIMGSGNLVHNLRLLKWNEQALPYEWAAEFDQWLQVRILQRDFESVLYQFHKTTNGKLSVPTLEHYVPLHFILGACDDKDQISIVYKEIQNASISMLSICCQPKNPSES